MQQSAVPTSCAPGFILAFAFALSLATAGAEAPLAWPEFRGPGRSGVSAGGSIPLHFGPTTNLAWRLPVPGGHSSPVIWGDDLYLTGFESNRLVVLSLDRLFGRERWRRELEPGRQKRGLPYVP